jgi:hypothetical protein
MTDARIRGVTRLDQQLVYVPLAAVAAALYAVGAHRAEFRSIAMSTWIIPMYGIVVGLVGLGLARSHVRHWHLQRTRHGLLQQLRLESMWPQPPPARRRLFRLRRRLIGWLRPLDLPFALGRPIYFALFVVGFSVGCVALLRMLG